MDADVERLDHRLRADIAEERDLAPLVAWQSAGRQRQSRMSGWMPIERSSLTECWVGLVLSSPALGMKGIERQMNEHAMTARQLVAELADRLEEGQALDVADRAADLAQHEIDVLVAGGDEGLDRVGDVRNDLDGRRRDSRRGAPWR